MNIKISTKDFVILSYFCFNGSDYILYTVDDGIYEVYLSLVSYLPKKIQLEKIDKKSKPNLKKLLNCLLGQDLNTSVLKEMGYRFLPIDQLKANTISQNGYQTILLTKSQYQILSKNVTLQFSKKRRIPFIFVFLLFLILLGIMFLYIFILL